MPIPTFPVTNEGTMASVDASINEAALCSSLNCCSSQKEPDIEGSEVSISPHPTSKMTTNIVLIGETGSGKTTMLNLLANVCAGVDLAHFKHQHTQESGSGGASQTYKPSICSVVCQCVNVEHTLNIVDTSGFTYNHDKDKIIGVMKDLEVVDAIVILANGTLARMGDSTQHTLNIIANMFPRSIVDNIYIIFTMLSDKTLLNFELSSLPKSLQKAPYWCIDNPFPLWERLPGNNSPDGTKKRKLLEERHTQALSALSALFQHLDGLQRIPTNSKINELHGSSKELSASIATANAIATLWQLEERHQQLQDLNLKEKTMAHAQVHKMREDIINAPYYEQKSTKPAYNTICLAKNCYKNCQVDCGTQFTVADVHAITNTRERQSSVALPESKCDACGHLTQQHGCYSTKWIQTAGPSLLDTHGEKHTSRKADGNPMFSVEARITALKHDIERLSMLYEKLCEDPLQRPDTDTRDAKWRSTCKRWFENLMIKNTEKKQAKRLSNSHTNSACF